MNANMVKALVLDAVYQVLDNRVFRIMAVLVLLPIGLSFAIGFREEEMVFLFGLKRWDYGPILGFFTDFVGTTVEIDDKQGYMVGVFEWWLDRISSNFGVIFTIAATAFFVPQMIEKGAADVLFHKPIGRLVLYLSRYFTGLLFIGLLSLVLVGGVYFGFLIASGYNDPGILWGALTLTYLFGVIHSISMLVGVLTRSTVAAILLSILFFFLNGGLQIAWGFRAQYRAMVEEEDALLAAEANSESEELEPEEGEEEEEDSGFWGPLFWNGFEVVHCVLPKTGDADVITRKVRRAVEGADAYDDELTDFAILELPAGFEETPLDAFRRELPNAEITAIYGEPTFAATDEDSVVSVWRRDRREIERQIGSKTRYYTERSKHAGEDLAALLGALPDAGTVDHYAESMGTNSPKKHGAPIFMRSAAAHLKWERDGRYRHTILVGTKDWFHTIEIDLPATVDEAAREDLATDFLSQCGVRGSATASNWYDEKLDWDAEWRFNIFFSIGSTLLFTAVMLGLGWLKLSRIDF